MKYLVAIHHRDHYQPAVVKDDAMRENIDALNREMVAAAVRDFDGGLQPAGSAKSLQRQPDGKVLIIDGPYLETKEHIGGFWILDVENLEESL